MLVFATGFDALTGALTRIDPEGPGGERLSEIWADGPVTFLGVMVPRLPNLFSFSGPGSPSVLANMVLHAEVQVDWAVEPDGRSRSSGDHGGRAATRCRRGMDRARRRRPPSARCFLKARSSWYLGANIDGKKRVFMPYAGGFGTYRKHLDDVAQQGYSGLVLTTRSPV